jgi:hypothetical protein
MSMSAIGIPTPSPILSGFEGFEVFVGDACGSVFDIVDELGFETALDELGFM